jgi:hypothetical protein
MEFMQGAWPVCDDSPLTAELFEKYRNEYGLERALGYLDAVSHFQKHFLRCFAGFSGEENGIKFHQKRVGADHMVKLLFHRNEHLLDTVEIDQLRREKFPPPV